jgi:hypothetical protein
VAVQRDQTQHHQQQQRTVYSSNGHRTLTTAAAAAPVSVCVEDSLEDRWLTAQCKYLKYKVITTVSTTNVRRHRRNFLAALYSILCRQ